MRVRIPSCIMSLTIYVVDDKSKCYILAIFTTKAPFEKFILKSIQKQNILEQRSGPLRKGSSAMLLSEQLLAEWSARSFDHACLD